MSPVSSKLVPFPSSGDFNSKAEFGVWLEGVKAGKARSFCYVSDVLFGYIIGEKADSGASVLCSEPEIEKMNEELGVDAFKKESLLFDSDIQCDSCSRQLNFYDIFKVGMQTHGKEFLIWASTGRKKFVGVPDGTVQRVRCSDCGHGTKASVGYATDVMSYNYLL